MPELPEVEVVCQALSALLPNRTITGAKVRQPRLRLTIPENFASQVQGQRIERIERRGKYLCLHGSGGGLLIHFGMSGTLRWLTTATAPGPHDHVDIHFATGTLRYNDPRRFGLILWSAQDLHLHPLLANLGLEPLANTFNGRALHTLTRTARPLKTLLMDGTSIVGVGNIYAAESLYVARLNPWTPGFALDAKDCQRLSLAIKGILRRAIRAGGSTIRNFTTLAGDEGHFRLEHHVYGRHGEPCHRCNSLICREVQGGRSTFWCPSCQPMKPRQPIQSIATTARRRTRA